MSTITIKINERTSTGKVIKKMILALINTPEVEIIEEKNPYNPEFVKKILNSHKNDKRTRIDPDKLWENI